MIFNENDINEGIGVGQFPKSGYCLIIMGAPGCGKSFLRDNHIPLYGKIFDLDEYAEKYAEYLKKVKGVKKETDLKTYSRKWARENIGKYEQIFLDNQNGLKNNIIFDIGGQPAKRTEEYSVLDTIIKMVKPLGYKIGLIWVVANRSVALKRNLSRKRVIPDKSFHDRTNKANKYGLNFLTSEKSAVIDDAWVVFNSGSDLLDNNIPQTRHLEKSANGFIIPDDVKNFILDFVGPAEKMNGYNTTVYHRNSDIKKLPDNVRNYLKEVYGREFNDYEINLMLESILSKINYPLNESLSSRVFHFTTLSVLIKMLQYNIFILSHIGSNSVDRTINSKVTDKEFFMSFTRNKSLKAGYAAQMNGENDEKINKKIESSSLDTAQIDENIGKKKYLSLDTAYWVRIEVDSNVLNSRYKSFPTEYFHYSNGKNVISKFKNPNDKVEFRQSEDRLVSDEQTINLIDSKNKSSIIKRIDIYLPLEYRIPKQRKKTKNGIASFEDTTNTAIIKKLQYVINKSIFKDKIFIYDNEKDFNYQTNNTAPNLFVKQPETVSDTAPNLNGELSDDAAEVIAPYIYIFYMFRRKTKGVKLSEYEEIKNIISSILSDYAHHVDKKTLEDVYNKILNTYKKKIVEYIKNPGKSMEEINPSLFKNRFKGEYRLILNSILNLYEKIIRNSVFKKFLGDCKQPLSKLGEFLGIKQPGKRGRRRVKS